MRGRFFLIGCAMLCFGSPALACRCLVANTLEAKVAYADRIAARAHLVALGRFTDGSVDDFQQFTVNERLAGSRDRELWVAGPGWIAPLNYSGSCVGGETWQFEDRVLVLRRREEEAADRGYLADSCATRFLQENPDMLARLRAMSHPPRR